MKKYLFITVVLFSSYCLSQTKITGLIIDGEFNEPLPFANVIVEGSSIGATSNFDGVYIIDLPKGTYNIFFSFIGYESKRITDIVISNEKELTIDVILNPASSQLEEVVVTTTAKRNSETSVLNIQKKSVTVLDGLSIQSIRKSGDSDIAGAIKRVPGVSVEGGKYVYVRGLGDRYSSTTLNGMNISGLDPDRNTIPLDIFPTTLIDNVLVKKTASSDMSANFTGGVVDINLKDFSSSPTHSVNFSTSFNPDMNLKDNFVYDPGKKPNLLGQDAGDYRKLMVPEGDIPRPLFFLETAKELPKFMKSLNPIMSPKRGQSGMNYNFGFSSSNSFNIGDDTYLGYLFSLNYKLETSFYENVYNGNAIKEPDGILVDTQIFGDLGVINNYFSALGGVSIKDKQNKLSVSYLLLTNGESNALEADFSGYNENVYTGYGTGMTFTEKSITAIPIIGKHVSDDSKTTFEWKVMPTVTNVYDKDFKTAIYETDDEKSFFRIAPNVISTPFRGWRFLDERSNNISVSLNTKEELGKIDSKFKVGFDLNDKTREFSASSYLIQSKNFDTSILGGNSDLFFDEANIWSTENNSGFFLTGGRERTNQFESSILTKSLYLSADFKLSSLWQVSLGARSEKFTLEYTGEDIFGKKFDNEKFIDDEKIFFSANLIYSINDNVNLRGSFYQTTARPSFKEASASYIIDPIRNITFLGNPEIVPSYINNFDMRFEIYGKGNNFFALSGFYKKIDNPIELVFVTRNSPNEITVDNNTEAEIKGLELELRNSLYSNENTDLGFILNASYISSEQVMDDIEYESRVLAAEVGQQINRTRDLQGQSPYMINSGLVYNARKLNSEAGLFFNVQGKTLERVGIGGIPDVYTYPFHSLNFNSSVTFGENNNRKVTIRVNNILNDVKESFYNWYNLDDILFSRYNQGVTFSLGYSLKF